jgi:hypothetical protein
MAGTTTEPTVQTDEDREEAERDRRHFVAKKLMEENSIRCGQLVALTCQRIMRGASDLDPCVLATASLVATQGLGNLAKVFPVFFPARADSRRRPTKIVLELVDAVRPDAPPEVAGAPAPEGQDGAEPVEESDNLPAPTEAYEPTKSGAVDLLSGMFEDDEEE